MKKIFFGLFIALSISACSTAGPYVTNISSDGNNGLNVEKCGVEMNGLTGTISTSDCTSQHITLSRD